MNKPVWDLQEDTYKEYVQRLEMYCDELSKRDIPMKVRLSNGKTICPINNHRVYGGQKYCQYCGQRLDWS